MKNLKGLHQTNYEKYKMQVFATAVACLSGLSMGTVGGYISPTMQKIRWRYSLNEQEVSLVTSIHYFGSILGGFASGAISDHFGRKPALIFSGAICALGWLVLLCAESVAVLYAARIISGFAVAIMSTAGPVYVTEIASPEIRGALGSCYILFVGTGVFYAYVIGAFVSWRYLAVACMGVPTIQTALMLFLHETPTWLKRHNFSDDAVDAMNWLSRSDNEIDSTSNQKADGDTMALKSLMEPAILKPLAIVGMLTLITHFSGLNVIILNAVSIFSSATDAIDPNMSAIIVAVSLIISHIFTLFLVDIVGRRVLLLISTIFMSIGLISMGVYYYMQENNLSSVSDVTWLPLISLNIYVLFYGMGIGPVPWLMMGELFPNQQRGLASGIITTLHWISSLIVAKVYIDMQEAMHDYGVFWFYGAVSVFAIFFTYWAVPETKGMTINEIEVHFKGSNKDETRPLISR